MSHLQEKAFLCLPSNQTTSVHMHAHVQHTHQGQERGPAPQQAEPQTAQPGVPMALPWSCVASAAKLACLFPSPDSQSPHPLFKPKLTSPNARGHLDPVREKLKANRAWCGLWSPEYFRSQQQGVHLSRPYSQPGLSLLPPASCTVWGAGLIKEGHMEKVHGETLAVRS